MRRSSITIWRAARRNLDGLPDCPDTLSEPAYASLLFTTNCTVCATADIPKLATDIYVHSSAERRAYIRLNGSCSFVVARLVARTRKSPSPCWGGTSLMSHIALSWRMCRTILTTRIATPTAKTPGYAVLCPLSLKEKVSTRLCDIAPIACMT